MIPDSSRINFLLFNMFKSIPGTSWQQKLEHCNNCTCCYRHSINRPRFFKPWVELPFSDTPQSIKNMCQCPCRHNARFICRQCDDEESPYLLNLNFKDNSNLYFASDVSF